MPNREIDTRIDTARLFIGVQPDAPTQRFLDGLVAQCKALSSSGKRDQTRWTSHANRHLTLAFLGETAEPMLAPLERGLGQLAAELPACSGRIVTLSPFPQRRSRLLAAELLTNPGLDRLHEGCRQLMIDLGLKPESAAYRPHFTLGRSRRGFAGFEPVPLDFTAQLTNIVLYESLMAPGGSQYHPLWEGTLTGPNELE
ncbi:RNA 2',3'-cyclic phosphodiesterase [Microbulbifer hainanensis]|uniref:RNA 2',3'-cyclic phosphodiesterase n=1 Tax=Microbulbifer hainanensis TaxID=2735675 RepID=UPI0018686182|nr:RNA 2',3'-cyclic phosphodiesterase [Microbulbifer hainanensis]